MLVLARKKNESVVLGPPTGETAEITIIEICGDKVRLGIQVPREWMLHRSEVWAALKQPSEPPPGGAN
jgi:carbon storage regulator